MSRPFMPRLFAACAAGRNAVRRAVPSRRADAGRARAAVPALAFAALALAPVASAQEVYPVTRLIGDGDVVGGVGAVTSIENLAVNAHGDWIVEVDTDNVDTNSDGALVKDGGLLLQENGALPGPGGATVDSFDTVDLNASGHSGWNFFLSGTGGTNDDSGVYFDLNLLVQEGQVSSAAAFTPGTPYIGFFECKLDDANDVLVMASVDDPAIASTVDRALVRLATTPGGTLASETVLWKEGDVLPGQVDAVTDWETGPHAFALNNAGQVMHSPKLAGPTAVNQAIYIDDTPVAQKGSPSPVAGRNWSSLSGPELDLNDSGDWVLSGSLDGDAASNLLIERSGARFVQEGDALSDLGGFRLTGFGSGPLQIGNNGNVLWFGDWDDPDTTRDTGLFLGKKLIVQEGVTRIGGLTVKSLVGVQDGYALSTDGRYVIFEARLAGDVDGAFLIDTGPWTDLGHALAGTRGDPALLATGLLLPGSDLAIHLTEARDATVTSLVIGAAPLDAPFKGGTMVPDPLLILPFATDGDGKASLQATWPAGIPAGTQLFVQDWVPDAAGPKGFAASNAVVGSAP